jgi:hypothetical protein
MLIQTIGQNQQNVDLDLKTHATLSPSTYILSLSPQSAISHSLFLYSLPNSPLCILLGFHLFKLSLQLVELLGVIQAHGGAKIAFDETSYKAFASDLDL